MTAFQSTVRIGVVAQESDSQSIIERTKRRFVEEMKKNIGEDGFLQRDMMTA